MKKQLPIGLSNYKKIIDNNYYYVDKTLNISMAKYFFEKTDVSHAYLFEDKKIWQLPERAALQGKFSVIFLTFKDIKEDTWQATKDKLVSVIAAEYARHKYVFESDILNKYEKVIFNNICEKTASESDYHNSLQDLSAFLYRFHKVRPFVFLDEYDSAYSLWVYAWLL